MKRGRLLGNAVKTVLIIGILSALLIGLGSLVGGRTGVIIAFVIALVMNGSAYFFSDKLALRSSGAVPIGDGEQPRLRAMVRELAAAQGLPMPKLYMIPSAQANAFATGRSPKHAAVAVTQGIMQLLDEEELRGVLAHEMGHVKNRDILVSSIAAVIASAISFVANFGFLVPRDEDDGPSPLGLVGSIAAMILVPLAATVLQLAVSRSREFGADKTGAQTIGHGGPLASALAKIERSAQMAPMAINPAYSSLYIANPLGGMGSKLSGLFSTHPATAERIRRLERM